MRSTSCGRATVSVLNVIHENWAIGVLCAYLLEPQAGKDSSGTKCSLYLCSGPFHALCHACTLYTPGIPECPSPVVVDSIMPFNSFLENKIMHVTTTQVPLPAVADGLVMSVQIPSILGKRNSVLKN